LFFYKTKQHFSRISRLVTAKNMAIVELGILNE
jgi:hypothetical protein